MFSFIKVLLYTKKSVIDFFSCENQGSDLYCAEHLSPCASLKGVQDQGKQQLELQVYSLRPGDKMPQEPSGAFNVTCI